MGALLATRRRGAGCANLGGALRDAPDDGGLTMRAIPRTFGGAMVIASVGA